MNGQDPIFPSAKYSGHLTDQNILIRGIKIRVGQNHDVGVIGILAVADWHAVTRYRKTTCYVVGGVVGKRDLHDQRCVIGANLKHGK